MATTARPARFWNPAARLCQSRQSPLLLCSLTRSSPPSQSLEPSPHPLRSSSLRLSQRSSPHRVLHNSARSYSSEISSPTYPPSAASSSSFSSAANPPPPATAPKASLDIRHIRENPSLYASACRAKNYASLADQPSRIQALFDEWKTEQDRSKSLRQRANQLTAELSQRQQQQTSGATPSHKVDEPSDDTTTASLLEEARVLKSQLSSITTHSTTLQSQIQSLALSLPNLLSAQTPIGSVPLPLDTLNPSASPLSSTSTSHASIGSSLKILDLSSASTVSGWGFYFLQGAGALLEQALLQYALSVCIRRGFTPVAPPSLVYSHIAAACGFRPRDSGGEQQIYTLAQDADDARRGKPELSLAATAEIPLAGMKASTDMEPQELPLKVVGVGRCFRAEAGARGVGTKGLYRVHEFSKVEMFAWSAPDPTASGRVFDEVVDVQREILRELGLRCRVLEQPSEDLGASAARKVDIEAFFPSRVGHDGGWGEVSSASECTDYQSRRLATRVRAGKGGKMGFPYTVNGTALAVPRVLAALLEMYWDENERCVRLPEVLWPWMHGITEIRGES